MYGKKFDKISPGILVEMKENSGLDDLLIR